MTKDDLPELYEKVRKIAVDDVVLLEDRYQSYGDSWKSRGGAGAYMVAIRKADRLDNYLRKAKPQWDVFEAAFNDPREEGVLDDIGDLRRYLLLIEAHIRTELESRGQAKAASKEESNAGTRGWDDSSIGFPDTPTNSYKVTESPS